MSTFNRIKQSPELDYLIPVFGFIGFGVIFISFFDELALTLSPVCISILESGKECSLCGMTRSFIAISNFDFSLSFSYNKAGVPLYTLFLLTVVIAIRRLYTSYNKKKKMR